eukprot:CAMPEP_0197540676 /NCGR_PEP_ID=MMETSP1318-20131121/66678_1 /TAXON_ID=552666 /ORGANISM="Partenskyella glossopodia, Strain RCC365" /LENGTH=369 /DNA_ID=CAMNT_0043099749 /DNA_START=119 /DNA_END=1224 /DNA_ORIENTATION=-
MTRSVLWIGKYDSSLVRLPSELELADKSRRKELDRTLLRGSYVASRVRNRITMMFAHFLKTFCQGSTDDQSRRYDASFSDRALELMTAATSGSPSHTDDGSGNNNTHTDTQLTNLQENVRKILAIDTWVDYFQYLSASTEGGGALEFVVDMSSEFIADLLRSSIKASLKLGYHTSRTDFKGIQASGTSHLLSVGESQSQSSQLDAKGLRNLIFRDTWSYKDATNVRYLDAICIAVDAEASVIEYVDYLNRRRKRNGAQWRPVAETDKDGFASGELGFGPNSAQNSLVVLRDFCLEDVFWRDPEPSGLSGHGKRWTWRRGSSRAVSVRPHQVECQQAVCGNHVLPEENRGEEVAFSKDRAGVRGMCRQLW